MEKYIALLRGINVSGQKIIKMAELKVMFEKAGFKNVQTYIQSGNVVFDYKKTDEKKLVAEIGKNISRQFGFDVSIVIRTSAELNDLVKANPFNKRKDIDFERLYITLLSNLPDSQLVKHAKEMDFSPDEFIIQGKEVYLYCPISYGNSKINNTFFEKKLKVEATTRNLKTMYKLIEMAQI